MMKKIGGEKREGNMWQTNSKKELAEWRRKIDSIDKSILELLSTRLDIVKNIKLWKKATGKAIVDVIREKELFIDRLNKGTELGLDAILIIKIFDLIIQNSRQAQS